MTDEPKDDAERAEAEALALALDQGQLTPSAVDDAVDAAGVVRMLKAPVLSEERLEAALAETERRIAARRRWRRRWVALGAMGSALAMAAAALLIVRAPFREATQHSASPPAPVATAVSAEAPQAARSAAPNAAAIEQAAATARQRLIEAQVALLDAPSAEARELLEGALRDYRGKHLSTIEQEYSR
jgi:hypothetical protein